MTATTSQKLADVLRAAGLTELAGRAEADEFHDYLSIHDFPQTVLAAELYRIGGEDNRSCNAHPESTRLAALNICQRLIDGEFDASDAESDEWAASDEGQATLGKLGEKL